MTRRLHRFPTALLPSIPGLQLDQTELIDQTLTVHLRTTAATAPCPRCQQASAAVHSRYTRTVADLPWGGTAVHLVLHVRKFFCRTLHCAQRIFTERLPDVVAPYARATTRLVAVLRLLAFALGGEAGARLCQRLYMPTSPATLIALIRHTSLPQAPTPQVLGVDDWAKRKGINYGTILVDLEAHRVVDLLPDRTAETLTTWLQQHPGVHIMTRDRSERYAAGGKAGAPDAVQVADRWHLIHNWAEVVERVLRRHHTALQQVQLVKPPPANGTLATSLLPPKSINRQRHYADARRHQANQHRMERWTTIRALHAKGMPMTDIARTLRLNYKTVRKYADATECPHLQLPPPRPRLVTPYEPYLRARWVEGCRNGQQLYREIKAHGFRGSRVLVAMVVAQWRRDEGLSLPWLPTVTRQQPLTPRDASHIVLRPPQERRDTEQQALVQVRALHTELDHLVALSDRYAALIRHRQVDRFTTWLANAQASHVKEIRQFARNVRKDEAAVRAALVYEHSNGQVEGQVHRLKLVKRSMYGRAKFDLLRLRVLYSDRACSPP